VTCPPALAEEQPSITDATGMLTVSLIFIDGSSSSHSRWPVVVVENPVPEPIPTETVDPFPEPEVAPGSEQQQYEVTVMVTASSQQDASGSSARPGSRSGGGLP
jgi:hypothetical protein